MNPDLKDVLVGMLTIAAKRDSERNAIVGENLMQGLGVIQNLTLQAQATVSDDAGLIAALQTAATAPRQGAVGK